MRELKFRVWNHGIKQMYDVYGFNQRQIQHMDSNGKLTGSFSWGAKNKKSFTLLQFVGMKDKTGKDIYEGDIIRLTNSIRIMQVFKHCFWLIDNKSDNKFPISMISEDTLNSLEVIGNIYENPELLL